MAQTRRLLREPRVFADLQILSGCGSLKGGSFVRITIIVEGWNDVLTLPSKLGAIGRSSCEEGTPLL